MMRRCVVQALRPVSRAGVAPAWTHPQTQMRSFFSKDMPFDRKRDEVNRLFATAMDEIDGARETIGTTYFQEDLDSASEATKEAVAAYELLIQDEEKGETVKSEMHLKMDQLQTDMEDLAAEND